MNNVNVCMKFLSQCLGYNGRNWTLDSQFNYGHALYMVLQMRNILIGLLIHFLLGGGGELIKIVF